MFEGFFIVNTDNISYNVSLCLYNLYYQGPMPVRLL